MQSMQELLRLFCFTFIDQKPFWKELPDAKYELKADHCVIYLTSFCWVKYEIDNKIVVAKRIKVYTATRGMEQNDQIAEVEVGYFIDIPGRAEVTLLFSLN